MPEDSSKCPTCGQEPGWSVDEARASLPDNPVILRAQGDLRRQVELLERISGQLERLAEQAGGEAAPEELGEKLEGLRLLLKPRHSLCTDRGCGLCRLQEEAIKEHVLLYVDWKVPGVIARLGEERRGQ